ncbi:hypothetical protein ACFT8W_37985 [Streptomyces hygroscopicus]
MTATARTGGLGTARERLGGQVFLGREDPYARRPPSTDIAVPVT